MGRLTMSFQVDRGLFKFDLTDHHAVLGIPIGAEGKEIRKRYLKIARRLHPDSCLDESDEYKKFASQLLSKLVNPAYEQLMNDRHRAEHMIVLGQLGKRLMQEQPSLQLQGDLSKKLAKAGSAALEPEYKTVLKSVTGKQYDSLEKVLDMIAQASELNMIYLLRKGGQAKKQSRSSAARQTSAAGAATSKAGTSGSASAPGQTAKPVEEETSYVTQYCRRAEQLIEKNNFAKAILELRDALKMEPNNSRCHSLMGTVYLKQKQLTMAKVHFAKALKADPNNELALKGQTFLEKQEQKTGGKTPASSKASQSKSGKANKSGKSSSGFLGGLFGGKKK